MKVQHVIVILSDGRKGLFTGKPFVTHADGQNGVVVTDMRFTDPMEMKSVAVPDVDDVADPGDEQTASG